MNLHNQIMNLPCSADPKYFVDAGTLLTYKFGHRDARHAAAELAVSADSRIDDLEKMLNSSEQLVVMLCLELQEILDDGVVNLASIKSILHLAGEPK